MKVLSYYCSSLLFYVKEETSMKFHKLRSIIIVSLVLLLFLTPAFLPKAEATSRPTLPNAYLALFFSHLAYDGQQAVFKGESPTGRMLNGIYSHDFNKDWITINKAGYYTKYTPSSYGNAIGAGNYRMYAALSNPKTNFYGAIYRNIYNNTYIVTFAGTDKSEAGDLASDKQLGNGRAGGPDQIRQARMLVKMLPQKANAVFTGHSLGGYIAAQMTIEFGKPSIVFNAPGFTASDLKKKASASPYRNLIVYHQFDRDNIIGVLNTYAFLHGNKSYYPGTKYTYGQYVDFSKVAGIGVGMHSLKNYYTVKVHQGY